MEATKPERRLITSAFKQLQNPSHLEFFEFPSGVHQDKLFIEVLKEDPCYLYGLHIKNVKAIEDGKPEPYPFLSTFLDRFEKPSLLERIKRSTASITKNIERLEELLND